MENIKIYESPEFGKFRTLLINGEPWFIGKDIAKVLGYAETANMRKLLEKEECTEINPQSPDFKGFVQNGVSLEPNPNIFRMLLVNESGLYNSTLPKAKEFKRWVTSDVLPSIRKHGVYAVDEMLANPDTLIAALTELKAEREAKKQLETTVAVQTQQISELQPKASYYDVILNCKDLVSTTEIAKDYGKSAKWLNALLHDLGVQFKQGGIWLLYQKYATCGYTSTRTHNYLDNAGNTHAKVHTYWTQKGRIFIYNLLKGQNILPNVEKVA